MSDDERESLEEEWMDLQIRSYDSDSLTDREYNDLRARQAEIAELLGGAP